MSDASDKLHQTLDQLHEQLDEAERLDPQTAAQLKKTIGDIRTTLQEKGLEAEAHSTLSQRLSDAAIHFEESHPTISGTLERLVDMLAQMGI